MANISAVVLTKNEEDVIEKCLKSLSWVDETIVVDDNSTDKTTMLAKKYKAKIFKRNLNSDFSSQRNFALKKAKNDWVLYVDADEEVSNKLKNEIIKAIQSNEFDGYFLNREDYFLGKNMKGGEWGNITLLRLGKKSAGKWKRAVHEYWHIKGKIGVLHSPLLHNSHRSMKEFIKTIDFYSTIHAKEHQESGVKSGLAKIIFFPIGKFLNNFIWKKGFVDGTHGLVYSIMMSLHSFLAWSKLYIMSKEEA